MAQNISYGIGQYKYDQNFEYTTDLTSSGSYVPRYVDYNVNSGLTYKDVIIPLPEGIVAGETYFMTLTLPQDPQFDNTINLKLCAESNQLIDFNKFQQIKQITIPHSSEEDYYIPVALFNYSITQGGITVPGGNEAGVINTFQEGQSNNININTLYTNGEEYKYASASETYSSWDNFNTNYEINNIVEYNLMQNWTESSSITTTSISFIFSPKYDLINPYKYLWLEIVRNNIDQTMIKPNQEYVGRVLPIENENIVMTISKVNNLISSTDYGIASIKSGINSLCQIDVSASTGQIISINGEEIVIGTKETYNAQGFDITSLGIIPKEKSKEQDSEEQEESSEDQKGYCDFIINYKYMIEN